jgi:primosomal protein N' (replication factor Y)
MYQILLTDLESAEFVAELDGQYEVRGWVEVLVDCPGAQGLYGYEVPADLEVQPGDILSVPFGAQQIGAIAVRLLDQRPEVESLRRVEEVVCRGFFPPTYWQLLHQVAEYYHTPLIQVVRVALPPGLLKRSQRRIRLQPENIPPGASAFLQPIAQQLLTLLQAQKQGDYTWQYLQRQVRGASRGLRDLLRRGWVESYLEPPTPIRPKLRQAVTLTAQPPLPELSTRQQEVMEVLRRQGGEMWVQDLLQSCRTSSSVLKSLEKKGWVVIQSREMLRLRESGYTQDTPKALTAAQATCVNCLTALQGTAQVLLHGVTGSGKTEVYLQAIAPILQANRSALVLVPEIGLTPQLTDRFRARLGDRVQVYHSALADGERYDTWRQMLQGIPQVVIGTRSAVFAPLPNLGLIVLDEEHDGSFKQDQPVPCYHARTVAQWRSHLENCPLVLGSATPSLETWRAHQPNDSDTVSPSKIQNPKSKILLSLPQRINARPLPPVEIVDMRQELQRGNRSMFSHSLQVALHQLQEQRHEGKQGLLFIPRRGHSTFVSCRSCGTVLECTRCDISLTYHETIAGQTGSLRCHYCGYGRSHPSHCPTCGSSFLKHFGGGTQRVVQELAEHFPELRCIRFDSDTTRAKDAHRILLNRFAQGEAEVLVGTQMLTKGIDLPQLTLVGVVAADGLLHLADFRASERAFQTLTQVAGRAGRGDDPGQVIVQTYSPDHPVIQAVKQHDYATFIQTELEQRAALGYPPYGRLILLRLSSGNAIAVQQAAERVAEQLCCLTESAEAYELLGPAPASIQRVANRYRWQILLKLVEGYSLPLPSLETLRSLCPVEVSLTVDIDPLTIL